MPVKTAIIIGCSHPLVAELARRYAARGNHVLLLGVDEERLLGIARNCPERIETLSLSQNGPARLAQLHEAWGSLPLHSYIDLSPFCSPTTSNATLALDSIAFLSALKAGLRAGVARAAIVFRDIGPKPEKNVALKSLLCRASIDLAPAKVLALQLRGYDSSDQVRMWADKLMGLSRPRLSPPPMVPNVVPVGYNPSAA